MQPSPPTDHELLRAFVNGDQAAFATLLQRHERMVYSTALRRLNEAGDAEDAAQQTFLLLARYASRLKPGTVIGGWLHLTACHQADTLRRTMQRRRQREHRAAQDPSLASDDSPSVPADERWLELAPHLDSALACLPARLRDAIVVCLLENHPRPLAAAQLGCTPEALTKRLTRAIDKLRELLARRGATTLTGAALAGLLLRHGSESHAAGLAIRVLAAPLAPLPVPLPFSTWAVRAGLGFVAAGIVVGVVLITRRAAPLHEISATPHTVAATPIGPAPDIAVNLTVVQPSAPTARPAMVFGVPATNPYAPALAAYAALSKLDQDDLYAGRADSPEARAALDLIVRCFAAGRRATQVDWGMEDGASVAEAIDHVAPACHLAHIVGLYADGLLVLTTRRDVALDLIAFGRHLSRDGILIQLNVQYGVTDQALDHLDAILPELALPERATLASDLRALPQGGTLATALAREKTLFLDKQSADLEAELLGAGVLSPAVSPASVPALAALETAASKLPSGSLCSWLLGKRPVGTLADMFDQIALLSAELSTLYAEIAARPDWFADPGYAERRLSRMRPFSQDTAKNTLRTVPEALRVEARLAGFMTGLGAPPAP